MSFFSKVQSTFSSIPGKARDAWNTIGELTPGDEVARGFSESIALRQDTKEQEKLNFRQSESVNSAIDHFREAKQSGDENRIKRARTILEDFSDNDADFITDRLDETKSTRQLVASAGELMLTAMTGGSLKLANSASGKFLGKAAKQALKFKQAKNLSKVGKAVQLTATLGKEGAIGSGFFALAKAQDEDATTEDIVHAAELGFAVGPGVLILAKGGGALATKAGEKINPTLKSFFNKMEKRAVELQSQRPKGGSMVDEMLSNIGEKKSVKQYGADIFMKGTQEARQFKARFLDRHTASNRMQDLVEEASGRPLKESEKVYRNVRMLTAEADAFAERKVVQLADDLRPFNDIVDESKAYLTQLDLIDRSRLGNKVAGGRSQLQLEDQLRIFADEVGPEKMQRLGQARKKYRAFQEKSLQDRVDAGLISAKEMSDLKSAHPNYIPHNVLMDSEERAIRGMSNTLNVSKTDLQKAVGSTRKIDDPFVATVQRARISERTIQKNKWLQEVASAQDEFNVLPGMKQIPSNKKAQSGFDKINFFKEGKKVTYQVPKDLAISIKGTDIPIEAGFFKLLTGVNQVLKKGATGANISFGLPNTFRDKQTALLTAGPIIEEMAKKAGVNPAKIGLGKKELKDLYTQSGGYGASVFKDGDKVILDKMEARGMIKQFKKSDFLRVDKAFEKVNEQFEVQTRLNVFKRGLERGLNPKDSAYAARNATIDFAKMGSWMQSLNKAIPFLNARVQGFANLAGAVKRDPEMFARMQLYSAVYPTVMLHSHNRRYDSYGSVSDYHKARNWIIMTGEVETTDKYTGEPTTVPQYLTIPKGEGQSLVSGPIQHFLDKADGVNYKGVGEMIADTIGAASPVSFQSFGEANVWSSMISQLGPLASIPTGLATNQHPFFGKPIIPEDRQGASKEKQFAPSTPEVTKKLANMMNVAPAQLEFVLDSFGGLPQDLQSVADMAFGYAQGNDLTESVREQSLTETDFGTAGRMPITRAFMQEASEFYSPESEFRKEQKKVIKQADTDSNIEKKEFAEEIFTNLNKMETNKEKGDYLDGLGPRLNKDIKTKVKRLQARRKTFEVLTKTDSVSVRAQYLMQRIGELKSLNTPREEIKEFLDEAEEKGILTKDVKKTIHALK